MNSFENNNVTGASGFIGNVSDQISHEFTTIQVIKESEMHFVAQGCRFGRLWILKGINSPYRENEACLALLLKEFEIMLKLSHNNIVRVNTIEEVPGMGMCIVMEYIDGMTLPEWLSRRPSEQERFRVAMELIDALEYIRRCDIVHRDIKPDNIMITRLGNNVKIIDFGLADSDSFTIFKQPAGTPGYMSPEQFVSAVPRVENDIFSLGKVLETLLFEKRYRPAIDACLQDASHRPSSFAEVKTLLTGKNKTSRFKIIFLIAAVALALAVILSTMLWKKDSDPEVGTPTDSPAKPVADPQRDAPEVTPSETVITPEAQSNIESGQNEEPEVTQQLQAPQAPAKPRPKPDATVLSPDVNSLADEGRAQIMQLWDKTAMNYLDTLTDVETMLPDWSTAQLEMLRNEFMATLPDGLDEAEKEYIRTQINKQIDTSYKEWTKRRLQMK